jgi:hypothetical protein
MSMPTRSKVASRRECLALACELDRLNLRLAMKPSPAAGLALSAVEMLAAVVPSIPGLLSRRVRFIMKTLTFARGVIASLAQ